VRRPLGPVFIVALGALAYSNTIDAPFVFDDVPNIVLSHQVRDLGAAIEGLPTISRAVGRLSFALNHAVHGFDVRGYHLVNLAIHLLASLCVGWLAAAAYRAARSAAAPAGAPGATGDPEDGGARLAALAAGSLFVAHPVQTQAVSYLVQRFASLATLLYVASLLLYARSRAAPAGRRVLPYAGSLACAVLAMRTKEIAFTLPLAIVLYELLFVRAGRRERLRWLAAPLATLAVIPAAILAESGGEDPEAFVLANSVGPGKFGRLEYLLTQPRVVVGYLRLLVLPVGQNVDPDVPLHRTVDWQVALSALVLAAILGAGAWLAVRGRRGARPHALVAGFGVVFFFLALSVESSIVPIADLMAEHRLYLPAAGAFVAAGAGLAALVERLRPRAPWLVRAAPALVVVAAVACAGATWARNRVWASPVALWRDAVEKSPNKLRPLLNYAAALRMSGDLDGARRVSLRALAFPPTNSTQAFALGIIYRENGDVASARRMWEAALEANPSNHYALVALGTLADEAGDRSAARALMERALEIEPAFDEAHLKLGLILEEAGEYDKALFHYETFMRVAPPWRASAAAQIAQRARRLRAGGGR
jgi:Flp pilus assembly protein TadD